MLLIDETKSYLAGNGVTEAGVPFEVDDEAALAMLEAHPTLREFEGDEPEPTTADEFNEPRIVLDLDEPEPDPPQAPAPGGGTAVYKSGGWYDLGGESVRLKDIPEGVKIVRR